MTNHTILANARIVLPEEVVHGAISFSGGTITAIDQGAAVPAGAVDCEGDYVAPGLIELHTDNLERHISPRPRVEWPHEAAILAHDRELAGTGITTVFDAMRVGSIHKEQGGYAKYARQLATEMLALRAKGSLKISHFLHLRAEICSETLADELAEFMPEDRIGIVSLMDHTPGQRQFRDISKLKAYVMGKSGMDEAGFAEHVAHLKHLQDTYGAAHEDAAVTEGRRLGAVLASHDDTTPGQVDVSAGHGVAMAEFPTTIEAAKACHDHGIAVIMGAPNLVRGGSHSGNVAAKDLAEQDLLDIISSDYVPSALLMSAVHLGEMWDDLPRGIATVTTNPAASVGLDDRGKLETGKRADLLRFARNDGVVVAKQVWSNGRQVA
ncbi:MAG: alpha-D-ribose 1-methylphosphonate 5-triphosphate diphosphatase [Pseudomonadota bacterium]